VAEQNQTTLVTKLAGVAVTLVATWATQRLINVLWTRTLGHEPPKPEDEGDARLGEIAAAAAITGAAIALSRVLATRGAARLTARRADGPAA